MAMTSCRECGQAVSSTAATCPHCGVSRPSATPEQVRSEAQLALIGNGGCLLALLLLGALVLLLVVSALIY
jgi:hypothetical protein